MSGTRGLRERLASVAGVWEGSYTHLTPAGAVLETYRSRQETRLDGDRWYERIIYLRDGAAPEVLDFRARFEGDDLVFDAAEFEGGARLVDGRFLLFPYRWSAEPGVEVVELVTFSGDDYKSRLWKRLRDGRLEQVTVIEEHRVPGEEPEIWH
ncbi:hypothetical protein Ssi03_41100 [Sphaerisporangium siamense]|uniref:DUF3598 domain-containing protein n=1 Tax=Sphaerisporangium siamense TaxID=795645 RepID=A0A7W7DFP9_9ACTN|nr:DUF3598 family protein [Sphaerisporangium siamense]MBB4704508.1 hypothetical protein [Sphaerisporangium siamense]GII86120.1 hypothetical protein Ssi03_41100 [Sphaerisporangium siamense]